MFDKKHLKLYAVTDRSWLNGRSLDEALECALQGGVTLIQLREKNLSDDEFYNEALRIKKLCHKYNVPLIINDNVDVALKVGADGVHVGQSDLDAGKVRQIIGEKMILGCTAKTVQQAIYAQSCGADYLGAGAVFGSVTKTDASYLSFDSLKKITQAVDIPVCAIGGINKSNILKLKGTNISGAAVISGIFASDDIKYECQQLLKFCEEIIK